MTPAYAAELGFTTRKTSIGAHKIDGLLLETHGMTSARFSIQDNVGRIRFFEETFLLADTSIEVILGIIFLTLSNVDFQFDTKKLTWRSYTAVEALPTTSWVEFINKKEFVKAALDRNSETIMVHVATLEIPTLMSIHLSRTLQV